MHVVQNPPLINEHLLNIKENILATLAYFDMFNYPLTSGEIGLFLKSRYAQFDFDEALRCMVINGSIYRFGKLYMLKNDHQLTVRRREGNRKAAELIKVAEKVSAWLIRFPYVRGIAISGSLSKNFADENSDIDLFIITAKNRLWIARTLMHAFKKLTFLVNRQDYFCMNYYIDEQQLGIIEKNIYTAIEIVTLMPLQGDSVFERFYMNNVWTQHYFPNKIMRLSCARPVKDSWIKHFFELLFNNAIGNALDNLLMNITAARWCKKTLAKRVNLKGMVMAMDISKHHAKPDPVKFQHELLMKYENKLAELLHRKENSLAN
jgi:predicted nucleotidyltransferase